MFPSPVRGTSGPGLTWFQLFQLMLIAAGIGGGWFALKLQLDTQEAQILILQQGQARMENKFDDFTRTLLSATAQGKGVPAKQ